MRTVSTDKAMQTGAPQIQIGLAGWSNPPDKRDVRMHLQTHLSYYAQHFSCVEINSSFYRPHQERTYSKWREDTPAAFRFSVKMPQSITHEARLKRCAADVARFYQEIENLQPKLSAVLVQLPPSLEFNSRSVRAFFSKLPTHRGTRVVCEPRHSSWFTRTADIVLREAGVARVAADPPRHAGGERPGGRRQFAYFRWHGSPRLYYSKYSDEQLGRFASIVASTKAREIWCVFDNTARHAAWDDALVLSKLLAMQPTH
jgi:uncharacterized protein YecE (DUF72 family)